VASQRDPIFRICERFDTAYKNGTLNPEYRVTAKDGAFDRHIAFYENTWRCAFTAEIGYNRHGSRYRGQDII